MDIFAEKMWVASTHVFFSKNISIYAIFNDQSFNDTLTNDIIFEQLGPDEKWILIRLPGCAHAQQNVFSIYSVTLKVTSKICSRRHSKFFSYFSVNLIVLGFNDMSTLEGHFVSSPREREKRDRRESRGDEREGQGDEEQEWKWRNRRNKNIPPLPLPTTRIAGLAQL